MQPFTALHPVLGPSCSTIRGPFAGTREIKQGCNTWAHTVAFQPQGTFRCRLDGGKSATKHRGKRVLIRCSRGMDKKLGCPFRLTFEQAEVGGYFLSQAVIGHAEECRDPLATPAEMLAQGNFDIPQHLLDEGIRLKRSGFSTGLVNKHLMQVAAAEGMEQPTWRYDHLDRALEKALPDTTCYDAEGVLQWLVDRDRNHGLHSAWTLDDGAHLSRIFYEVDGGREEWRRAESGMRLTLYDTTHGTNIYSMKLGCFTAVNAMNHTILLAVSLIKREDAKTFVWVFEQFKTAFGCEPDTLLTDGDLAMAAAAKFSFPGSRHLLCIWHLTENLMTHAIRLFPPSGKDSHVIKRKRFKDAFRRIMTDGGLGTVTSDEYFNTLWDALMEAAGIDKEPPADVIFDVEMPAADAAAADADITRPSEGAVKTTFEEMYESAEEDLRADPRDADLTLHNRAAKRRKKSAEHLVWEWLAVMKGMKEKWARVYTIDAPTRGNFVTNRAEGWHKDLKQGLGSTKKLLVLVKHIDTLRKFMDGRRRVKTEVRRRDQEMKRDGYPPALESIRKLVSPSAFEKMMEGWADSEGWVCREILEEETEGGADEQDNATHPAPLRRFRVGTKADVDKGRAVVASLTTCSARCMTNMGLPCRHVMRVHKKLDMETMSLDLVHPFWRTGDGVGDEEEESESDDGDYYDAPAAVDFEAGETPVEPEEAPRGEMIGRDDRFRAVMQACRGLAEVGKRSRPAFEDVIGGVEELIAQLDEKHSRRREGTRAAGKDPITGEMVMNPTQEKKGRGRTQTKRKRGAGGR